MRRAENFGRLQSQVSTGIRALGRNADFGVAVARHQHFRSGEFCPDGRGRRLRAQLLPRSHIGRQIEPAHATLNQHNGSLRESRGRRTELHVTPVDLPRRIVTPLERHETVQTVAEIQM